MTAPIVLFVYARLHHTKRTIDALKLNLLASESDLHIFSDGPRDKSDQRDVDGVRAYLSSIDGFRSVNIVHRAENYGLARNIVDGVNTICSEYNKFIVLEDDIVTSPHFLSFMNIALNRYANEAQVWHISGWNYPIAAEGMDHAFFWRGMNCWGWASWSDRWRHFEKQPARLLDSWDAARIGHFNLDGAHDFWSQVESNYYGRLNTWAIFWYATIHEKNGLCLNPVKSLVTNIGNDGSGTNSKDAPAFTSNEVGEPVTKFPVEIAESPLALERISNFYRKHQKWRALRPIIKTLRRHTPFLKFKQYRD